MPVPAGRTIGEAHSGRVPEAGRVEEGGRRRAGVGRVHTRHSRNRKKRKGDVGVEKEKEKFDGEEREKSAHFFYSMNF